MDRKLTEVGEALYGKQWRRPLAIDLKVNERTVLRCAGGDSNPPDDLNKRLAGICRRRAAQIRKLEQRLTQ